MLRRPRFVKKQIYGQLVIGPPGSGKTTYCHHANIFFNELGRDVCVVNLDPANDNMDYKPMVDIRMLITLEDAMKKLNLGPNGALMYCIEYLDAHFEDWLLKELRKTLPMCSYFIFDCPGQVELYTHHESMAKIFQNLERERFHLVTVNLIDSHYCVEPEKFISTLMMSLSMMLRMALPHVNVLSKADLLEKYSSKLAFNIDFYTNVLNLNKLVEALDNSPAMSKYRKLNAAICSMIEDYSLVSYHLLNARSIESMLRFRNVVDKANGYIYQAVEEQAVIALLASTVDAEKETLQQEKNI